MADEQPVAIVDHLHIELEVVLIDIEGLLEAEALAAVLELPQNVAANIHLHILVYSGCRLLARRKPREALASLSVRRHSS
jgi:prophage antirepressor-like protein